MENREQQILSEIRSLVASVRSQLELLDAKMAEFQQIVDPQEIDVIPIDIDIDVDVDQPVAEQVDEPVIEPIDEHVEEPVAEQVEEPVTETVEEPVVEQVEELLEEQVEEQVEDDDDLPFGDFIIEEEEQKPEPVAAEPEPEPVAEEPHQEAAVIDVMTQKQAWRTDMPGLPVKDIRSAISLNDRVLFINYLFHEDPMTFMETLGKINQMTSLDEVVAYLAGEHKDWDFSSDVVYRFMMAVRRRIR